MTPHLGCNCERSSRRLSRRELLGAVSTGFGAVAAAYLLSQEQARAESVGLRGSLSNLHHPASARSVIFLYMDGGPSQVDTFDPKPRLDREHGQPIKMKTPPTQFNNVGTVLKSPWPFRRRGESGMPVSDLLPFTAELADELCVIRSMVSNFSEHTSANYFLHTGNGQQGRPSMGSWTTYGLGSESDNLPGFVVLNGGLIPPGGVDNFGNGFLPASWQGSIFKPGQQPIPDVASASDTPTQQRRKLGLLSKLDSGLLGRVGPDPQIESAIANYELAFRMQASAPEATDLASESAATQRLYGLDAAYEPTRVFGRCCLIARRLVERGVRFIELTCPPVGTDRWDQHSDLIGGHAKNAQATDQPIAGLLRDLKARGLLDSTLVVWTGEFGRTPMAQGSDGRDHNPFGFTSWMAGGGVRGGHIRGETDDYGYYAIKDKTEIHDLHATMLHVLGVDHKRLTYRFGGRDMRLTDVHGEVLTDCLSPRS